MTRREMLGVVDMTGTTVASGADIAPAPTNDRKLLQREIDEVPAEAMGPYFRGEGDMKALNARYPALARLDAVLGRVIAAAKATQVTDLWIHHAYCWGLVTDKGVANLKPRLTVVSHLQELHHRPGHARFTFEDGDKAAAASVKNGSPAIVPAWGDRLVFSDDGVSLDCCGHDAQERRNR